MKLATQSKVLALLLFGVLASQLPGAHAQGTEFTYQGSLSDSGNPFTGDAEFRPTLWSAADGGVQIAANSPAQLSVSVTNGLFVLPLDFGANFPGSGRWLQLEVRTGIGSFVTLVPRQKITPTPYALTAGELNGSLSAKQIVGTLPDDVLDGVYSATLVFDNPRNSFVGRFTGNGTDLTALNASQLATGTVPDARLGIGVARVSQVWGLTGNAGTTPGTDFVGTTDGVPLTLRSRNHPVLRLESDTTSGFRIIAGTRNTLNDLSTNSVILGGLGNVIDANAHESSIVGGRDNSVDRIQRGAFIGGGTRNDILQDNDYAVIVGGRDNRIGSNSVITAILGGAENRIGNNVDGGLILGGFRNDIRGTLISASRQVAPVLVGGSDNEIGEGRGSSWAIILGGDNNRIGTNAAGAAILSGLNNNVANNASNAVSMGFRAKANHAGAFVWADRQISDFTSAGDNTFNIRAEGGVHLNNSTDLSFGASTRQMINLWQTRYGIGVQSATFYQRTDSGGSFSWFAGGTHSNSANTPGTGGVEMMRLNSLGLRVNGTFVSASDRNLKENVRTVQPLEVLEKVAAMPVHSWNYKNDPASRHVGPMAQDFHAAFGLGVDDKHIANVDADGVALAAIQGLNQKLEETRAENAELRAELREIKKLLMKLTSK